MRSLIEDFIPIEAVGSESAREKSLWRGHVSTIHLWWAPRPVVACRAAVYGSLVPADLFKPENRPTKARQPCQGERSEVFLNVSVNSPETKTRFRTREEAYPSRARRSTG